MLLVTLFVMHRQLEEVDRELEVHRETERVLHEKVKALVVTSQKRMSTVPHPS